MTIPALAKLVPVNVKSVWPGEAASFTPWLLANAEALGEVLGMDLVLAAAEHKVGDFSLDLIGHDDATQEAVIIENQFGPTDHKHLGQLLTYAGGTNPTTVVWIAESFRDEHRAALDWLNTRTDSETRFFGVQLGAVTLTGAPPALVAPLLEVMVKPNDWSKQVKSTTMPNEVSPKELKYQKFWTGWLDQVKGHHWTNRKAPASHWMYLPAGAAGARYSISFRTDGLLSELYFSHAVPDVNQARWQVLADKQIAIEDAFGGPLVFDPLPDRNGCRIGVFRTGGESLDDVGAWPEYWAWFESTQSKLRHALAQVGGIPPLTGEAALDDTVAGEGADELDG